jgi:hypothetical protein
MSSTASYESGPPASRPEPDRTAASHVRDRANRRARAGLFRRGRERAAGGSWTCPGCGLPVRDQIAAGLGFCPRCQDFTGLCGAGRKLVCLDVMSRTTWHTPCTRPGSAAWQVSDEGGQRVLLLCPAHDGELRTGQAGWAGDASPMETLASP